LFFNKLKYTKYYKVFNNEFVLDEKKIYRIRSKRKNNRELRRWHSKFSRLNFLYNNKLIVNSIPINRFLSDKNYLIGINSKIFKNHILNIKLKICSHSNFWILKNLQLKSVISNYFINDLINGPVLSLEYGFKYPIITVSGKLLNNNFINYNKKICNNLKNNFNIIKMYYDNVELHNKLKDDMFDFSLRQKIFENYKFLDYDLSSFQNKNLEIEKSANYFIKYIINNKNYNNDYSLKKLFPSKGKDFFYSYKLNKILEYLYKNIKKYRQNSIFKVNDNYTFNDFSFKIKNKINYKSKVEKDLFKNLKIFEKLIIRKY